MMCLKPSALAIKSLQRHDLTLGDVYKIYNMVFISTAEIGIQSGRNVLLEDSDTDEKSVLCSSGLKDLAPDTEELMELKYEKLLARKERNSVLQFSDTPKTTTDLDII